MAAISTINAGLAGIAFSRQAATTSQTDWIAIPSWVRAVQVYLSITTAGTSTSVNVLAADPILKDDAQVETVFASATITAATNHFYVLGPYVGNNDSTDSATADSDIVALSTLPTLLGLQVTATGSTYTVSVDLRP